MENFADRNSLFAWLLVIIIVIEVLILGGFLLLKKSQAASFEKQITQAQNKLNNGELKDLNEKAEKLQKAVSNLKTALGSKVYYSSFLSQIKSTTLKNSRYTSISVDENNSARIDGVTKSYNDLAKILTSFSKNSRFSNVKLVSSSTQQTDSGVVINFSITLSSRGFSKTP